MNFGKKLLITAQSDLELHGEHAPHPGDIIVFDESSPYSDARIGSVVCLSSNGIGFSAMVSDEDEQKAPKIITHDDLAGVMCWMRSHSVQPARSAAALHRAGGRIDGLAPGAEEIAEDVVHQEISVVKALIIAVAVIAALGGGGALLAHYLMML